MGYRVIIEPAVYPVWLRHDGVYLNEGYSVFPSKRLAQQYANKARAENPERSFTVQQTPERPR